MKQENVEKIKNVTTIVLGVCVYWVFVSIVYLVASFASGAWNLTWITFPAAAFVFFFIALFYFNKKAGRRLSLLNWIMFTVVICVGAYLLVSFLTGLWAMTWIIFLAMIIAIFIEIMVFLKKPKTNVETGEQRNGV